MTLIIEKINKIEKLYHTEGCSFKQIKEAQLELGITFPDEYIDIIKKYGAISFYGTEWTGSSLQQNRKEK